MNAVRRRELVGGDRLSLRTHPEKCSAQLRVADRLERVHLYRQFNEL